MSVRFSSVTISFSLGVHKKKKNMLSLLHFMNSKFLGLRKKYIMYKVRGLNFAYKGSGCKLIAVLSTWT